MKRNYFSSLTAVMMVALMALASCSKKGELLDTIPADAKIVATIDIKGIMEQAGCKFTDSGIELPESFGSPMDADRKAMLDAVGQMQHEGVCDFSNTVLVVNEKNVPLLTFMIDDPDRFIELTGKQLKWNDGSNGYKEAEGSNTTIIIDGNQAWITESHGDAAKEIEAIKKSAKETPISKLDGVTNALNSSNLVNLAMHSLGVAMNVTEEEESPWSVMKIAIKENKIVADNVVMKGDGEIIKTKGLQTINQAVLAYIPGSFNIAAAMGLTPEFDWKSLTSALGTYGGFQSQAALSVITPYLQAIDGTVLIAAGPANEQAYSDIDPGNWQFILMAHLSQEKVNQIIGMVKSMMFSNGITLREDKNGMLIVPQYGMDCYIGAVDGYLAISNLPFENTRQNELAPLFNGKDMAVSVDLPTLKVFSPAAPAFGVKFTLQGTEDGSQIEFSLNGTNKPILETLIATLAN